MKMTTKTYKPKTATNIAKFALFVEGINRGYSKQELNAALAPVDALFDKGYNFVNYMVANGYAEAS